MTTRVIRVSSPVVVLVAAQRFIRQLHGWDGLCH